MASPWSPTASIEEEEEEYDDEVEAGEKNKQAMVAPARTSRKRARSKGKQGADQGQASGQCAEDGSSTQPQVNSSTDSKTRKSKAWMNFTKLSKDNAEETVAECNICHKILRAHSRNGTSHLLRHIKNVHPHNAHEINNYFIKSEKNDDGSHALRTYKFDHESLRNGISMFLLEGSHPFTLVEEHGFRTMMGRACPQFKNISRHTIRRDIMTLFQKERKDLIEIVHNSPGRVSFTSDNWKSDVTKFSFICITCHYIDAAWKLNKRIIWFKKLNPPYDGASIADEIHLCLREWKLDTKMMCMTLDNASYNDKMVASLKSHLLPKGVLPLFGTFFQVRCCAHILNLVVQAGLKLIDNAVGKLRDGIQYIKASSIRMSKFYEGAQTIFQLEVKRKLKVDMPVRWNSTYTMLENALYFKDVFLWFAERDSIFKSHFLPSYDEWDKLSTMHGFLRTFYDVTCMFSSTKHPTSNLYFKCVYTVHTRLLEAHAAGKKFMAPMLVEMKEKFDKYWSDYSIFLSCAAVLDPRYKLGFIAYCYSKLYANDDAQRRVNEVRSTLTSLFEEYRGVNLSSAGVVAHNNSEGGADLFNDYEQYMVSSRTHEVKSQLDLYLDEPARGLHEKLDVLEYWSKSSMRYPELASMARDILAVPVSSVASESAFSMSRKVLTTCRGSLKPKTTEALMCLQDWYRSKMQQGEANEQAESSNVPSTEEVSSDSE